MTECDHLTHPEHWPGDAGDIIAALEPSCEYYEFDAQIVAIRPPRRPGGVPQVFIRPPESTQIQRFTR